MRRRGLAYGMILCGTCLSSPGLTQTVTVPPSPERYRLDALNVDHISDTVSFQTTDLQMGPAGPGGLALVTFNGRNGVSNSGGTNWENMRITQSGSTFQVSNGFTSTLFTQNGSNFTPVQADGSQLVLSGSTYILTTPDGVRIEYGQNVLASNEANVIARANKITYPTGEVATLVWRQVTFCYGQTPNAPVGEGTTSQSAANNNVTHITATTNATCSPRQVWVRLQSVANSQGYALNYIYSSNDVPYDGRTALLWQNLSSVSGVNNAAADCYSAGGVCGTSAPTVYYNVNGNAATVTDPLGRSTRYTLGSGALSIKTPSSTSDDIVYSLTGGLVTQVQWRGLTYGYATSVAGNVRNITVTDPLGHTQSTTADTGISQILSATDGLGHTYNYTYDAGGNLLTITTPKGNQVQYTLDSRGNATTTTYVPVSGSGLANFSTSAVYPSSCSYAVSCNKPASVTDVNGNTTSYYYDNTHGGVTLIVGPTVNGVQPQTLYTYSALQAYYINGSGTLIASGVPVYRLTATSQCRTNASCAGTADEIKTTIAYGTPGAPNNLLPTSVSTGAGDGSLTSTTVTTYDSTGNLLTVDGPLPGNADVVRYRYDADREQVGIVGPDPDGGGPLRNRAQRISYAADGQVTMAEVGTVASQADGDWAGFSSLQQVAIGYDSVRRVAQRSAQAGGTTFAATQYSYDGANRLDCTAVRMNPANFGSLPASACTPAGAGSYGPDRIVQNHYDNADQLTSVTAGLGDGNPYTQATYTYNLNGNLQTMTDANGNLTRNVYDGFVRLSVRQYPDPANPGIASTTDYDQYNYDNAGNVTARRLRNGTTITYGYDVLNRLTSKILPSGASNLNSAYAYDLIGNLLSATSTNGTHRTSATFTYDALGRQLTQASSFDGIASMSRTLQYDLAGRRTRLTWGDGFYVSYDYDVANEMIAIRENGGTALASFGYDDLGRRTSRSLANGTSTSYGYDAMSRLTSLTLNGGTNPTAVSLGNYGPSGQLGYRTNSNDAYAWTQGVNVNRPYVANGQNRYASIAGSAQSYDAKGNLSGSFGATFGYDAENNLASGGGYSFYHDALGRLAYSTGSGLFDYDGATQVEQTSGTGTLLRRYVFGPGTDEPILWYEGSGSSDRRYLDADERGSITRITDGAGNTLAVNSYDEFGIPATTNLGRFQYTGQAWLAEVGLYDYKARAYSTTMGRFMQPDPIGYGDGLNFYNYVHGDPVNATDPTGLDITVIGIRKSQDGDGGGFTFGGLSLGNIFGGYQGPGGDGDDVIVVGKKKKPAVSQNSKQQRVPCSPNGTQLATSGKVIFQVNSSSGGFVTYAGASGGYFTTASGIRGQFRTVEIGVGVGLGIGLGAVGTSRNLSTFTGSNYNLSASAGVVGGSLNFSTNNGSLVGGSGGLGTGSVLKPGVSAAATYSDTQIYNVTCPR